MAVTLKPVQVETRSADREGLLMFDGDLLLAILIRLSNIHAESSGAWCLEYGPALSPPGRTFGSLEEAVSSISEAARG